MFNKAQNFTVDSTLFYAENIINVPKIDLFFKNKPTTNNNFSGLYKPGITVYIVGTTNHLPNENEVINLNGITARVEYDQIVVSNDGTAVTPVIFPQPYVLPTGEEYSILIQFDGNENFILWENQTGEPIVLPVTISANGSLSNNISNILSTGPSCKYVGALYHGSLIPTQATQNSAVGGLVTTSSSNNNSNTAPLYTNWNAEPRTCLKFNVYYNRYFSNGQSVITTTNTSVNTTIGSNTTSNVIIQTPGCTVDNTGTVVTYTVPARRMEYINYDFNTSNAYSMMLGDRIWQQQPFWAGGSNNNGSYLTCAVVAGSQNVIQGNSSCDFTKLFNGGPDPEYIILHSSNHNGAGLDSLNCRRISSFNSSAIVVDRPITFSNSTCYFYKSTVGALQLSTFNLFQNGNSGLLMLQESNANNSCRFVDCPVANHSLSNSGVSGTGYNNTDVCFVTGFENIACVIQGNYQAVANVVTNSNGSITNLFWTNTGCGFVNTSSMVVTVKAANGSPSNGSGASISITVGALYRSERTHPTTLFPSVFNNANLMHLPVDLVQPNISAIPPESTGYQAYHSMSYYRIPNANVIGGYAHFRYDNPPSYAVHSGVKCIPPVQYQPVMPSRSKEFVIYTGTCGAAINSSASNTTTYYYTASNSSVVSVNATTISDNTAMPLYPNETGITFYRYLMNNDYTLENTRYGNCISKQIEQKVTFANNQFAEDLKLWLTAYRPVGTDFKVFAKFYNTNDSDPFDDKEWTLLLDQPSNIGLYSDQSSQNNVIELGYGLYNSPNTAFTLAGAANATLNSSNLVGFGTTWQSNATANVTAGKLIKFYQPLFPNTFQIAVVNSVVNDTFIILNDPVVNNGIIGTALNVDVLAYPFQAFNNQMNDNIIRYYNSNMVPFDTYNVVQYKFCFLSVTGNTAANTMEYLPQVPYVDDIRAVNVSV